MKKLHVYNNSQLIAIITPSEFLAENDNDEETALLVAEAITTGSSTLVAFSGEWMLEYKEEVNQ